MNKFIVLFRRCTPHQKGKGCEGEIERALTEEVLDDLSRNIGKFWKSLGLKIESTKRQH